VSVGIAEPVAYDFEAPIPLFPSMGKGKGSNTDKNSIMLFSPMPSPGTDSSHVTPNIEIANNVNDSKDDNDDFVVQVDPIAKKQLSLLRRSRGNDRAMSAPPHRYREMRDCLSRSDLVKASESVKWQATLRKFGPQIARLKHPP
jgi:hypothetical protein